jgi:hypothetical protein
MVVRLNTLILVGRSATPSLVGRVHLDRHVQYVVHVVHVRGRTIQKARVLAAQRATSISGLVAQEIEKLVGEQESYERAKQHALKMLDQGFHLGGVRASRDELHER